MTTITASQVRELRDATGAPMMDCKQALSASDGDMEKATEWLRKKGLRTAEKKAGRDAAEGLVHAYIHHNGRVGVLVEINCETDFVAKTEPFQEFCRNVALHVASMKPAYVRAEEVPEELLAKERGIIAATVDDGKPEEIRQKILDGRIKKFLGEICLLDQPYVKDDSKTVDQYRAETVGTIGENIQIRRFTRYEIGV